jgi:Family of unknown function (DUF6221)
MSELAAFLAARLDEDEAAAKATAPSGGRYQWHAGTDYPGTGSPGAPVHWVTSDPDPAAVAEAYGLEPRTGRQVAGHIARHDPARVLREVEAKRRIIDHHKPVRHEGRTMCHSCLGAVTFWPCPTLQHLAAVWSDHPDYRQEWAVTTFPAGR